ncbi:hypothetical protein Drorol1_Dr00000158, partial [Drosera rotundifolia]
MDREDKDKGDEGCGDDFTAVVIGHRRGIEPCRWTGKTRVARGVADDESSLVDGGRQGWRGKEGERSRWVWRRCQWLWTMNRASLTGKIRAARKGKGKGGGFGGAGRRKGGGEGGGGGRGGVREEERWGREEARRRKG